MKTLFALTLLALVAGSYAASLSTLLSSLEEAEIESILNANLQDFDARQKGDPVDDPANDDYNVLAQGYDERTEDADNQNYLVSMQGDDDDDDDDDDDGGLNELEEKMLRANLQGWKKGLKKFGGKALKGIKTVASNPTVRGLAKNVAGRYLGSGSSGEGERELAALLAKMQGDDDDDDDDDDDGLKELEEKLVRAKLQGWTKSLKKFGSGALKGLKTVASNPMVRGLAKNVASKYLGSGSSGEGERELAAILAKMQGDDDDDDDDDGDDNRIAELEAMLNRARLQSWHSFTSKLKSFGSKVASGVKKVASNPIVKSIAKKVIDKYSPVPIPISKEREEEIERLLKEALLE